MNRARLVVIIAASFAAVGAAWVSGGFTSGKPEPEKVATTKEVMVAARDLAVGEQLAGEGSVKWVSWPLENVTSSMVTREMPVAKLETVEKSLARQPIYAGEPILQQKIMDGEDQNILASLLGKGRRAVTVSLTAESGVGGFILPDDRVDVLLIRKIGGKSIAQTVLTNVRVLALDQSTVAKREEKSKSGKATVAKTATLELEPDQAEAIAAASSQGRLTLVLRSLAETAASQENAPQLNSNFAGRSIGMLRYGVKSIIQLGP